MELQRLVAGLPEYAADLRVNFEALVERPSGLSEEVLWGTMVVAAMAAGSSVVTRAAGRDAASRMTVEGFEAAKRAAAMMALTNHFYKHESLTKDEELKGLRSGLRLNGLRRGAARGVAFKLWCVVVSVLHGCASCVEANEREARELGATVEQIAGVLRLGALVKAIAVVVEAETAFADGKSATDLG
jgi:alkyl hydroperoxide reductase subunit D